jgi:uncharacterized RDD family membrane protein YckC
VPTADHGRFGASLDVNIDLPLATAGSRGLARMIDLVLLAVIQMGLGLGFGLGAVGLALWLDLEGGGIGLAVGAVLMLMFLAQWFLLTWLELRGAGQTPGKMVVGIRVVRDDGGTLTLGPALLRNLLRLDTFPGALVIDLALLLWGTDGKRLGDRAAGTVVVVEPTSAPARSWPSALSASEVTLLGVWFARAPDLDPDRREPIAQRLVARLSAAHPNLVPTDSTAVAALDNLAPTAPR